MGIAVQSLNSGSSFKFFGLGKGVNRLNFITDTFLSFASRVFHPSIREAVHLLGGLMDNKAVKSDIHSTDTHGYTDLNFALTYFFDILLAPRIKQLNRVKLYGFEQRKDYENKDYMVIHDYYVDEKTIKENWEEMLQFLARSAHS